MSKKYSFHCTAPKITLKQYQSLLQQVLISNKLEFFVLSSTTLQDRKVMFLVKIKSGEKMEKFQLLRFF
jgi:hypothetical protein